MCGAFQGGRICRKVAMGCLPARPAHQPPPLPSQLTPYQQYRYLAAGGASRLYRGILPGTLRSVVSNGCSMVVMIEAQKLVTTLGLRG